MSFEEWFHEDENEHDLYNYPEEAMKAAWNAAIDEAVKVASELVCEADGYHACHHNEIIIKELCLDFLEKANPFSISSNPISVYSLCLVSSSIN